MPYSQDTVLTVPPYPFVLEDPSDVPLKKSWFARPQLYFTCHLRQGMGGRQQTVARMPVTTSLSSWCSTSTAPSKSWTYPVLVRWKLVALKLY